MCALNDVTLEVKTFCQCDKGLCFGSKKHSVISNEISFSANLFNWLSVKRDVRHTWTFQKLNGLFMTSQDVSDMHLTFPDVTMLWPNISDAFWHDKIFFLTIVPINLALSLHKMICCCRIADSESCHLRLLHVQTFVVFCRLWKTLHNFCGYEKRFSDMGWHSSDIKDIYGLSTKRHTSMGVIDCKIRFFSEATQQKLAFFLGALAGPMTIWATARTFLLR